MGYPKDLDEYSAMDLAKEVERRKNLRAAGRCDYCGRPNKTDTCLFPERHRQGVAKSCRNDGDYVLWRSKRDPSFSCEKHLGSVAASLMRNGDLTKPVQIGWAPDTSQAPCLYSEMCERR